MKFLLAAQRLMVLLTAVMVTSSAIPAAQPAPATRSGLDIASLDRNVRPQDDLFRFVNGNWLANTEIPADLASYGAFARLDEDAKANVRALLEAAVRANHPAGTEARKAAISTAASWTRRASRTGLAPLAANCTIDALAGPGCRALMGYNQTLASPNRCCGMCSRCAMPPLHHGHGPDGLTMPIATTTCVMKSATSTIAASCSPT
jgi:hypothetical protein